MVDEPAPTVAALLAEARALGVDRLDAQLLLMRTLGCTRTGLLAHDDARLSGKQAAEVRAGFARRAAGEPLAYVIGDKEFHGLLLHVDADVLVPRPDTEVIVDWALALLACDLAGHAAPRVIDLGTGSGAIALAVKHRHPAAEVLATDVSAAALAIASRNAERLGLAIRTALGSWWQAAPNERFELVLANPPYIAGDDHHLPALRHEPRLALTPEGDGLAALRAIVVGAGEHLAPAGWLLLEHGHDQAEAVTQMLHVQGFSAIATHRDLAGHGRCTGGRR